MAQKTFTVTEQDSGDVTIDDLGAIIIRQASTVNLVPDNFTMERVRDSVDLKAKIESGDIVANFGNLVITNANEFDAAVYDYNAEEIEEITKQEIETHKTGLKRATIAQDLERIKEGTTTADTPFIAPFLVTYLRRFNLSSRRHQNATYDITISVNNTVVKTFNISNDSRYKENHITGINASENDEIRYRIEQNGTTTFDVSKLECDFTWSNKSN